MRKQLRCPAVLPNLVLLTIIASLTPTLLSATDVGPVKSGKHKHPQTSKQVAKAPGMPAHMRRAESFPGRLKSGEREGGPLAYEREKLANRAYPGTDIPIALTDTAKQHFARVRSESEAGSRGPMVNSPWVSLGPSVAFYTAVVGRPGAPYVASGRTPAMPLESH